MQEINPGNSPSGTLEFLSGGGEMGERIRNYDWSATSLGPIEFWPKSLRTCIRIMLTSRQPIWIGWGKELIKFYNDPYKAIVGGKHPWALGNPASVVWKDIWKDIEPMLRQVMEEDEGTYVESQLLIMERNGYPEETYYTFSYTPIPGDDGKTEGMFCANTDDTDKIISERQLKTLTRLGKRLVDCKSTGDIIHRTIDTLSENPQDFPFALFRTISKGKAVLAHSTPLGNAENFILKEVDLNSGSGIADCINTALETRKPQVFEGTIQGFRELPKGVWEISAERTLVLPVIQSGMKDPYGLLVVGLNPYRLLDEKYKDFFSLLADQVATSFSDVHVLQEERKRSEALAEIDRAKTTFFSNISHEFRTPLTLLLGPIEEIANDPGTIDENKVRINAAYRNALRLQRLVNTLLEFSRIEAGRMEGKFSRVDICSFTQDLASIFRSAVEKAGLQLRISCSDVKSEVYVDTDMWEKIVLNLVSNAFKYTKAGAIDINVLEADDNIVLSVSDTGVGVQEEHLEKIFDRFHRIENIQGRSQEGTGIGLAFVKELVKLHNGTISVTSQYGKGSTFTVTIPTGKEHLLPSKIMNEADSAGVSINSVAFVEEAMKWIPEEMPGRTEPANHIPPGESNLYPGKKADKRFKVVLADDNADMREYMHRLLAGRFDVISAIDGEDAFNKVLHNNPDLLISDIMMPKLDGFGLLKKLRSHPERKNVPVIFLSARAGEEATVEGLEAGADDYLIKPFSARELIARVESQIKLKEIREAVLKQLYSLFDEVPFAVAVLLGDSLTIDFINQYNLRIWQLPKEAAAGRSLYDVSRETRRKLNVFTRRSTVPANGLSQKNCL